jgi:large subunit ribosomal protein L5
MAEVSEKYTPKLKVHYDSVVRTQLQEKFGYSNPFQMPRITKIVINMGVGEAIADSKKITNAVNDLTVIAGQKPIVAQSRKAIANFKLRENQAIGCKVTLRRERMWEFFDRLVNIALPRVRDFRGVSVRSFDGNGNYSLGLKEQIVFPEIDYDQIDTVRGMDITIVTTARTDEEARALLDGFSFPFAN